MAKRKQPEDTIYFHYHNANPKNKRTCDCVYRALSVAMNKPWKDIMMEMTEMACHYGYVPSDIVLINKYLKKNGWVKHKQPKFLDGKRVQGRIFAHSLHEGDVVIANIGAGHITVFKKCRVWDTWDCSGRCVGNYWTYGV